MNNLQLRALADYRIKVDMPVSWSDMDIYKHVNNANYFRYFEAARIRYFEEIGFMEYFSSQGIAGVLSSTSCHFVIPIVYPDSITVGAKVNLISTDDLIMEHFILSRKNGLSAIGESKIAIYDFRNKIKIAVPDFLRNAIEKFEIIQME